jgi:hypothetical protein
VNLKKINRKLLNEKKFYLVNSSWAGIGRLWPSDWMQPVKNLACDIWVSNLQRIYCNRKKMKCLWRCTFVVFKIHIITVVI